MKKVIKIRKVTRELFDTFIDIFKIAYCCLKNIFLHQKLFNTNLTIVTGSDFTHFDSVVNLLDSIIEHEPYTKIVLYDIGFYDSQVRFLNENYSSVEVIKFDFSKYPKFFSIRTDSDNKLGSYAWKSAIVSETLSRFGGSVLWLDAGDKITKKLTLLKIVLTSIGIYVPKSAGKISDWTHEKTIKLFNYKNLDLKRRNLASGMIGFNSSKKIATDISNEWLDSCKSEELIAPKGSDRSNHRQDQSLLTLICYKYKV